MIVSKGSNGTFPEVIGNTYRVQSCGKYTGGPQSTNYLLDVIGHWSGHKFKPVNPLELIFQGKRQGINGEKVGYMLPFTRERETEGYLKPSYSH